ncbi:MAG: GDSL-type esterase/lipase family protein [Polyangia bacterium]
MRPPSRLLVVLPIAITLASWPAAAQSRMPTHVACVGDSITQGVGASNASTTSYPAVLQKLFGSTVHVGNYGHSGATLLSMGDLPYKNQSEYTAATTFVSGAGTSAVVDVIIMLGTNDSKSYNWMSGTSTRAAQFVTDLTAMVNHFATLSTHPLVYLAYPPRAFTNTYGISGTIIHDQMIPLINQVAAAKSLPVIDVDTPTASHSEWFPDGVHPNDSGYMVVAQVMHDGLLRPLDSTGAGGQGGQAGRAGQAGQGGGPGGAGGRAGAAGSGGGVAGGSGSGGGGGRAATGGSSGTGGSTSTGGRSGTGGSGTGGASSGGTGGSNATGGSTGSGGTSVPGTGGTAAGTGSPGTDSGCSCQLPGNRPTPSGVIALLVIGLSLFRRRLHKR